MNASDAIALLDELERFVLDSVPGPHPEGLQRVKRAAFQLRGAPGSSAYIAEKLGALEGWADIYFSARKHQNYRGGADQVRQFMLNEVARIRRIIPA